MRTSLLLRRITAHSTREIGTCRVNELHIPSGVFVEQSSYECTLKLLAKNDAAEWCVSSKRLSSVPILVTKFIYGASYKLIGAVRTIVAASSASTEIESIWLSSTMKKRRMKMNKHKLKKRMKDMRANTKVSRG